jgi:branched-chain amino acid transport system substrate-binding protein
MSVIDSTTSPTRRHAGATGRVLRDLGGVVRIAAILPLAATLPLAAVVAACDGPPGPVIGVTTSAAYMNAADLAMAELDRAGWPGGTLVDTVLRPEASNEATHALRTAEELVATPGIAVVIGHSNSSASLAASQIYNEHRVVQLAPTTTAAVYSDAGPFSFRLVSPDDHQGRFLADALRDTLPPGSTIALLYVNDDYGRGLRSAVLDALSTQEDPPAVVLDLPHSHDLDASSESQEHLIEAVAASGPDAIVWLSRASSLHDLLPGLRTRVGRISIFGGDAVASAAHLGADDDRWAGVRYVSFVNMEATPEGRRFLAAYRERFGHRPGSPHALTYDAMGLVLTALGEGARTGPQIRDYLTSLGRGRPPYPGISGPIVFDERGDVDRQYHLTTVAEEPAP